jgi:uncharacterized protein YutD
METAPTTNSIEKKRRVERRVYELYIYIYIYCGGGCSVVYLSRFP